MLFLTEESTSKSRESEKDGCPQPSLLSRWFLIRLSNKVLCQPGVHAEELFHWSRSQISGSPWPLLKWFSNVNAHKTHLEGWSKHSFLGSNPRVPVGGGW